MEELEYKVGALLYSPANRDNIAQEVIREAFGTCYSLALCLEDAISDMSIGRAEVILAETLNKIARASLKMEFYLPMIFIRVRNASQCERVYEMLGEGRRVLTGFIFPKFNPAVADGYIQSLRKINTNSDHRIFMMPIIESQDIVDLETRISALSQIKRICDEVKEYVLNIRVGGNDFCKGFGIRRHMDETIYDIRPVSNILSDIVTCFGRDYVVSGPVWEYFDSEGTEWEDGMRREIKLDRLNGFIGKTIIHPKQIEVLNEEMQVDAEDYEDARKIERLAYNPVQFVEKSAKGKRMNEYKTHEIWAKKIIQMAKVYGVKERCRQEESKVIVTQI